MDMSSSQSTEVVPHERSSAPDFVRKRSPTCPSPPLKSANVPFVDQTQVLKCDSNGKEFTNNDHDITLRVPPGAIPDGVTVHIEAGVSLHGPFQFPPGTRPISPIIWFCTQEGILFLKPVEVILPHFLHHWEDLELGFLKADHSNFTVADDGQKKYTFQHSNDPVTFYSEDGRGYGILYTKHFCFSCIQSNITRDQLPSNAQYCLTKVIPEPWPLEQTNVPLHFCVTFSLKTCFKTLGKQFSSSVTFSRRPFTFQTTDDSEARLQIEADAPQCGWILARENEEIRAVDVDYWGIEHPQLQLMEEEKMYPPRFTILACGSNATGSSVACLRFRGSCENLSSEVPLPYHQPTTFPGSPTVPSSVGRSLSLPVGGDISPSGSWDGRKCRLEDMRPSLLVLLKFPVKKGDMSVLERIGTHYNTFGIHLLNDETGVIVDGIVKDHRGDDINLAILKKWLQGQGKQPVTWKTLVEVLRDAKLTVLADEVYENLSRLS